ncbi:acyl-CoA dehydrogenase [Sneathiella sp. P13V-1]|uniref:acyl-CoA dehydrogenase C-terminal domain-containing protein n=1 Tax=Sneathiella sp. P13V-1 TaxID=2697366 RepID=UPI00187B99FC|nr:acyl-CoA dehydrogenase C-terminal domain-containing protein [Sneathiella sp. P13V-1]MBE7635384.1 acyl-CoA dehydrogenase [Sneathiella sp. P13V-1]
MPIYNAPVKDIKFVLNDLLGLDKMTNMPGFEDATPDMVDAILEEGSKLMRDVIQPLNQVGDTEGCKWNDGEVTTPTGFKEAYQAYCEGGWGGIDVPEEFGGQGLPHLLGVSLAEMMSSANMAFGMYPGLTHGASAAILKHGTQEQKETYLPKMTSGEWTGTMNLTEPHCGTDLGLMRTKAEPQEDGSYKVSGTKIFISAGEHDMSDNIIHLVLAKIPGGPEGIKGVSLFIVPKFVLDENGNPGARNGVSCGSIEHKMGIHGNSTCVMNYDEATGYLLGDPHKGMRAMFTMMNAARLGVGIQGLSQAEVAYQNAVEYTKDRIQGRSITGVKAPEKAADPIIVHPDIRRNLLMCRAFSEGARALGLWAALQVDMVEKGQTQEERDAADEALGLLTPVIKAYFTDKGFELAAVAQQCFGGHGYIHEWGMEQFVRDARITQIYEGANGIQALDLVGRKIPSNLGRSLRRFFHPVDAFIQENMMNPEMKDYIMPLAKAFAKLQQATAMIGEKGMKNPDEAGAASTEYLHMFGLVALGYMWAQMAKIAKEKLANGAEDKEFFETKLITAQFFFERMIPDVSSLLVKMSAGSKTMMALDAEAF